MKVIAKYPFQAVPGMQQLSFPAGAKIRAQTQSKQGGWMYGSYGGSTGWFPESYVERYGGLPVAPPAPLTPVYETPKLEIPASLSSSPVPGSPSGNRERTFTEDNQEEAFNMMGGTPGDLFEGTPKPQVYQEVERPATPTFLQEKQEEPVDIYRHAPAKKHVFHRGEYTPEISVQITSAAPPPSTPTTTFKTKVAPAGPSPTTAADFWKAHPGRADKAPSPEQAAELERKFEGLRDSETIAIMQEEPRKKKFPFIPKSIKTAAKKTQKSMHDALHKFPAAPVHRS